MKSTLAAWTKRRPVLVVGLLHAVLVLYVVVITLDATAYDDSYFFKRFARNALHHGVFAWNVADGPVHGSTSQLFQLVATVIDAITDTHFVALTKLVNAGVLVAAGVLLIGWASQRAADPRDGALVALVALDTPLVLTTVQTGMESALTLFVLAATLVGLTRSRPPGVPPPEGLAAVLTALVYLARPDAAAIPFVYVVVVNLGRRRVPVVYLATLAAILGALLLAFAAYYGTALPLSFSMKTGVLGHYDAHFVELGLPFKRKHALGAFVFALPFSWIAVAGGRRADGGRRLAIVALGVAALALFCYHVCFTTEIMGYRGRFYLPAFVPLTMAAALGWDSFVARGSFTGRASILAAWLGVTAVGYVIGWIPDGRGFFTSAIPWPAYAGWGVSLGGLLLLSGEVRKPLRLPVVAMGSLAGLVGWYPPRWPAILDDHAILRRHDAEVTTTRGIFDVARCLPDARVVYHSEMGVPGLVLPEMRLVDLVGILSRETGIDHRPLDVLCKRDRPEAIFLPHREYRQLNRELQASGCLDDYRRAVDKSSSPLHIREDLFGDFMHCAKDVHRWNRRQGSRP